MKKMGKNKSTSTKLSGTVIANHNRFLPYLTSRVENKETADEILQTCGACAEHGCLNYTCKH